ETLVDVVLQVERHAAPANLVDLAARLVSPAALVPVADRVLDELERRVLAEVADGEDRLEDGLQADVLTLARQRVHLQEAVVGPLLDLDQIGNRNRRPDLGKVDALAVDVVRQAAAHTSRFLGVIVTRARPPARANGQTLERRKPRGLAGAPGGRAGGLTRLAAVSNLLDLDLRAGLFELLLDRFGLFLRHAFLDGLRRAFHEVLRLLEAEARHLAHRLDHVDLVGAHVGQHDVELGLLLGRRRRRARGRRASHHYRSSRGRRDAKLLFQRLDELGQLHHRDVL